MVSSTTALPRQAQTHKRVGKHNSTPSAGKIAAYASAFLLLIAVVAIGYQSPQRVSSQVAVTNQQTDSSSDSVAPSVDELVATGVAADLASRANLPIATNIANASISLTAKSELAQTDTSAITKPQIIEPNSTRTETITYTAVNGDTVPAIAAKYDLSADTVRWANNINGDAVEPGRKIKILPQSGVLYKVESGDTVASIATKYNADAARITLVNDLDLGGLTPGKQILIPDGVKPTPAPVVAPAPSSSSQSYGGSTGSRLNTNVYATAGNRYAYGNCTWYTYERRAQLGRPVGSFWGNAKTWASSARMAGYKVNNIPAAGSVLVDQAGYYGHNAVVERVMPNGDIYITEMNNYAYGGFGIVNDRTISAGQAAAYQYIH